MQHAPLMNGSLGCCTPFICHITPLHPILRVGPPLEDVSESQERSCCPCRVPICMLGGTTYNTQGQSSNKQGEPNNAHQQWLGCWRYTALTCSLNTCFVIIWYWIYIEHLGVFTQAWRTPPFIQDGGQHGHQTFAFLSDRLYQSRWKVASPHQANMCKHRSDLVCLQLWVTSGDARDLEELLHRCLQSGL